MKRVLKSNYRNKILAGSALFYIFSGITSLLNYLFYPLIGRLVSTGDFGEIQFLISMFNQLSVGFVILNILAIIISIRTTSPDEQIKSIRTLNHVAVIVTLPLIIVAVSILFAARHSLSISDPPAIIALGIAVFVSVPFTTHIGKLQGNGRFVASGVISILAASSKLLLSIIFIILGFGVFGAVIGIGLGTLLAYGVMVVIDTNKVNRDGFLNIRLHDFKRLSFIRHQALVALVVMTALTIASIFDSIVSRIFLSHVEAGQYAAIATTSKTILAVTTPLMWLALPDAVKHQRKKIALYSVLTLCAGLIITLFVAIFSSRIIHLLTSVEPGIFTMYAVPASIVMSLCSLAFLLAAVCVCRGQLKIIGRGLVIGVLASTVLFGMFHQKNPIAVALIAQAVFCSIVILSGVIGLSHRDA